MRSIVSILLITPFLCFGQERKTDSASINEIVRKIDRLSKTNNRLFTKDKLTGHKKYKETWQYFDNKVSSRIVIDYTIDSAEYSVACTEKYYFKDGSLICAYESEIVFSPAEGIDQGTKWAGDFYFSKGKLVDHVTIGHGNSESDDWDPEREILQKFKKRKAELKLLK
jgi:hypothetical protein